VGPLHTLTEYHKLKGYYFSSWEFFTNLDFEWSIIQGRRRYRWTIWVCGHSPSFKNFRLLGGRRADFCSIKVYSLARIGALVAVITDLILLNLKPPFDCQVCPAFQVCLAEILVLTCHNPKLGVTLTWVGTPTCRTSGRKTLSTPGFTLLGSRIPGPRLCLLLGCAPYVRHQPALQILSQN
jgi:hypothetical protein